MMVGRRSGFNFEMGPCSRGKRFGSTNLPPQTRIQIVAVGIPRLSYHFLLGHPGLRGGLESASWAPGRVELTWGDCPSQLLPGNQIFLNQLAGKWGPRIESISG